MTKEERRNYVISRAYELAKSGNYTNFMMIELALRKEGFPEARQLLDDVYVREELDHLCTDVKKTEKTSNSDTPKE